MHLSPRECRGLWRLASWRVRALLGVEASPRARGDKGLEEALVQGLTLSWALAV